MGKVLYYPAEVSGVGAGVTSFKARTGIVVPEVDDYETSKIKNDSSLTGTNLNDVLESLGGLNPAWAQYSDTQYTDVSPFTVVGGATSVKLPNNGLSKIGAYLPAGIEFYDVATQKITPQGLGENYLLRINIKAISSTNQNYLDLDLDIGGTQGIILERTTTFPRGSGIEHSFSSTSLLFSLGTFIANGGDVKISCDSNITVWDIQYVITRISANDLNLADAPSDGSDYGRKNGAWSVITGGATPTFATVTPATDYGNAPAGFETLSYSKNGNALSLTGILTRTGAGLTPTDNLICNLPVGFRPANEMVFLCSMGLGPALNNGDSICRVKANGDVTLTNTSFLNTNDVVRISLVIKLL